MAMSRRPDLTDIEYKPTNVVPMIPTLRDIYAPEQELATIDLHDGMDHLSSLSAHMLKNAAQVLEGTDAIPLELMQGAEFKRSLCHALITMAADTLQLSNLVKELKCALVIASS